jgi:hypothetical protein
MVYPRTTHARSAPASGLEAVMRLKMPSSGNVVGSIIAAIINSHASA